jgi:hypothetical protein
VGQTRTSLPGCGMSVLPPKNGHRATTAACPFRAINGLMHRSKQNLYSITSSARARRESGMVSPSALAAPLFRTNSNRLA